MVLVHSYILTKLVWDHLTPFAIYLLCYEKLMVIADILWYMAQDLEDVCEVCYCSYESSQLLPKSLPFLELKKNDSVNIT